MAHQYYNSIGYATARPMVIGDRLWLFNYDSDQPQPPPHASLPTLSLTYNQQQLPQQQIQHQAHHRHQQQQLPASVSIHATRVEHTKCNATNTSATTSAVVGRNDRFPSQLSNTVHNSSPPSCHHDGETCESLVM